LGIFTNKNNQLDIKFIITLIAVIVILPISIYLFYQDMEKPDSYSVQILNECGTDSKCILNSLTDIAKTEDQNTVLKTYHDILQVYDEIAFYCHPEAHHLAMFLYEYAGNLPQALEFADQKCGGSQYHGVVEAFFADQRVKETDLQTIELRTLCPRGDSPYSNLQRQCTHGVGHGLVIFYNDIIEAHQHCDEFELPREQESCAKGTFMQNVVQYLEFEDSDFDDDDLYYPCSAVDSKYLPPCYLYHSTYILGENLFDVSKSFEDCDDVTPEEYVRYCYAGVGRQMAPNAFHDVQEAFIVCEKGQPQYQSYCFTGLGLTLLNHLGNDKAFEYCKILPIEIKGNCYDQVGVVIGLFSETTQEWSEECSKAESEEYYEICINANLESVLHSYDVEL